MQRTHEIYISAVAHKFIYTFQVVIFPLFKLHYSLYPIMKYCLSKCYAVEAVVPVTECKVEILKLIGLL
jgi:hypothetical protein